ncbi:Uncharacterized protein SCF082_LOCUS13947 [Durusdinium trenchii]|uniref:Uncharacterized protein n=1 Tax=Durusdinium trenchii TaxID=1381693 RepID=A0ABP0JVI6_9DINO
MVSALDVMKVMIPDVKEKLIPILKKLKLIPNELKDLDSVAPLALPEQSSATATNGNKSRKVCSYKEMWKKDNAIQSLRTSALYEAGGSGFWMSCSPVDNLPLTAEGGVPCETDASASWPIHLGSWNQLTHAKALFDPSPHHHGRILFPVTLETAVKSPTDVVSPSGGEHPASLKLLCGHLILAAWWLAMHEAIVASDNDRIGALFEAMLTVTIRVTLWVSDAHVMKVAMASAERTRALEVSCDNVITFADRLRIVVNDITSCDSVSMTHAKCLDKLRQDGVLWQGKPVTRNMLVSCDSMPKNLSQRCRALLSFLESKYGRCLLTDGPTRLYRLIVSVVKFIDKLRLSPKPSVTDALEMLFSSLCLSLEAEAVTSDSVTTEFLTGKEKSSANDKPCWAAMSLMSIAVTQQARNVLALMEEATPDLKLVMETLLNPASNAQHVAFDEISRVTIESLKKGLCETTDYKRFEPLLDWGYSIADGQMACHIRDLVTCEDLVAALESNDNPCLSELRDALAALTEQTRTTLTHQDCAPKMSWRQLARVNSDSICENADPAKSALTQEREEVWAKAVAVRKGLIHIDHVKKVTRDTLKQCFDASPAKSFSGTLNEKHMMVVVSADLCLEEKSGWLDEFATEEEPTTAFVTYSNIPYPQNLPLIDYDIKAKMLGLEKTPADEGLIENYLAAQVVDLSCSLALARACLKTGTKYVGVAMSPEHSQWAQNAVNQDAIRVICESGHCLHQSSLSELLQKHFADLCQEGKEEDGDPLPPTPPS